MSERAGVRAEDEVPICAAPAEVDRHWLEAVLRAAGHDVEVASFAAERIGTGQVGQNVRFRLRYARGAGPATVVGKFASDDPESRQTGVGLENYLREVRFYQELRPLVDVRIPALLHARIDPNSHAFHLVMEDLAPAEQGDQIRGCTPEEASLALVELARLHGPLWNSPTLDEIDWLSPPDADSAANLVALWGQVFPGYLDRYADRLSTAEIAAAEALGARFGAYVAPRELPRTVTHGDYRLDNLLFGGPYPVTVVDWQSPGIGLGTADAAYFLGTSLEPEDRRRHEVELLRRYHGVLVDYGVEDYPFERCWQDYRRASFGGLVMAVIASMIVGRTERGDAMFLAMARRSAAMAADLEAAKLLD